MKKILFPTEFSPNAGQIYLYALDFAKRNNAAIIMLHTFMPTHPELTEEQLQDKALNDLSNFVHENTPATYDAINIVCRAEMGFATEQIIKVANEEQVQLIVMGMRGTRNALDQLIGNITLTTIEASTVPVLMVPTNCRFKSIEQIAQAFDFKLKDLVDLKNIFNLMGNIKFDVNCLHFIEANEMDTKLQLLEELEVLEEMIQYHPRYKNLAFTTIDGDFEKDIKDYLMMKNIDLFVLHSNHHIKPKFYIQNERYIKIAKKINIPMLVFKKLNDELTIEQQNRAAAEFV